MITSLVNKQRPHTIRRAYKLNKYFKKENLVVVTSARDFSEELRKDNLIKPKIIIVPKQKKLLDIKIHELRKIREMKRKRRLMDPSVLSS